MSDKSFSDWEEEEYHKMNGTLPIAEPEPEPTEPAQLIEFPTTAKQGDTDKPKRKPRKKKTDQLDMFGQ